MFLLLLSSTYIVIVNAFLKFYQKYIQMYFPRMIIFVLIKIKFRKNYQFFEYSIVYSYK